MDCKNCHEHSGHSANLVLHEKRLDNNDIDHRDIKKTLDQKIPRWIFLIVLGILLSSFGYQVRVLEVVNSIHNNVYVLDERLQNHMGSQHTGNRNQTNFTINKRHGRDSLKKISF